MDTSSTEPTDKPADKPTDKAKIEFPCHYPVKVIVEVNANIVGEITAIIEKHDPSMSPEKMDQNPSRNGKFISLRYMMWAIGTAQLEQLFEDLKQCEAVKMVL